MNSRKSYTTPRVRIFSSEQEDVLTNSLDGVITDVGEWTFTGGGSWNG